MCSINVKNLLATSPANSSVLGRRCRCLAFGQVLTLTIKAFDGGAHSAPAEKALEEDRAPILVAWGFRVPFQLDSRDGCIDAM